MKAAAACITVPSVMSPERYFGAHRITGMAAPDMIGKPPPFRLPEPGATATHKLANGRWLDVLCTALADDGELVIDFRVEKEDSVYPMVPSGADLGDMIRRPKS